ncbi:tol-pal system YbgF family protein [Aquimarina sp. SS2-1]|uniref:tetratricopeptide repeat protein n=1 Tax=Aquimarina besae TaxID=3342247 RepID=UPI00366ED765
MERTQELFEKIEGYLTERLSEKELTAFENEMPSDPELTLEVEKHRKLHEILSDSDTLHFKEKLQKINNEVRQEESSSRSSSYFSYFKIAAFFVVLIGLGTLLWNNFNTSDNYSNLYISYYEPYPVEDITRGGEVNEMELIKKNYANGNYQKVVTALKNTNSTALSDLLRLYLGNSYLHLDKEKEALQQFEAITDTSNYFEDASWYQALTYLKLGEIKKSWELLKSIIRYDGIYKEKATQLIEKFKEL